MGGKSAGRDAGAGASSRLRTVDVIIPTYKPDGRFAQLIEHLEHQTVKPMRISVVNTDASAWALSSRLASDFARGHTENGIFLEVRHISPAEFDHGGTRAEEAEKSRADVLLFLTQDAVPADIFLVERLRDALQKGAAAAYARQIARPDCSLLERYARSFNYGAKSIVKSASDLPALGIKTYLCSNVCAAYVRATYEALGGFERHVIFNEDMIFAAKLIRAGYQVAYAADARVVHSHNYTGAQQFRRNFDLAVSQADHPEIFADVPSEGEGIRLVKTTAAYLSAQGREDLLPKLVWQSGCKYAGYWLGKHYKRLPRAVVVRCSMNRNFWKNKDF